MQNKWVGVSILLFCIAAGQAIWLESQSDLKTQHRHLVPMDQTWVRTSSPVSLIEYEWIGAGGQTFRLADGKNRWHILFFGYTACQDVCPLTLGMLGGALKGLEQEQFKVIPKGVFISIDPEKDSPEKVSTYAAKHHPDLLGLTGTQAMTKRVLHTLESDYQIDRNRGIINHPTSLFLINPQGRLIGTFIHPGGAVSLKEDIKSVLREEIGASES